MKSYEYNGSTHNIGKNLYQVLGKHKFRQVHKLMQKRQMLEIAVQQNFVLIDQLDFKIKELLNGETDEQKEKR